MGWSKYAEDNNEIFLERMRDRETEYSDIKVECYSSVPAKVISVDLMVHVEAIERNVMLTDKNIRCRDCGKQFVFSVGEQEHFRKHNYCAPKRCSFCRTIKRKIEEKKFWESMVRSN